MNENKFIKSILLFAFSLVLTLVTNSCSSSDSDIGGGEEEVIYDTSISQPELTVFEAPVEAPKNTTFSVYVKYDGGEWIDLHEYDSGVDGGHGSAPLGHMSFVTFDSNYSKRIDVKIKKQGGIFGDVEIRPASAGVTPFVAGNTIEFSLTSPKKISVEINGDLLNNLMIFANSLETDKLSPSEYTHYYGPGIHKIGGDGQGTLFLQNDNDKVYIAGGAIVYGSISAFAADNISITGRGILSGDMYTDHVYPHPNGKGLIEFTNVHGNNEIKGITLLNTVTWNVHLQVCENVEIKNLKIIGWTINSDGIDPQVCSNILIDDCFIRNYDDCISIKLSWAFGSIQDQGSRNITVQNSTFWTDQGRALLIGPESASNVEKIFEDITFKNIDILYNENYDVDWAKGALAINLGDDATAKNITFEDIRVDKLGSETNLITLNIIQSPFNASVGKRIENITFNNISFNSSLNLDNYIHGFDPSRIISGVNFNNLFINGSKINNAEEGRFEINEFTENIQF